MCYTTFLLQFWSRDIILSFFNMLFSHLWIQLLNATKRSTQTWASNKPFWTKWYSMVQWSRAVLLVAYATRSFMYALPTGHYEKMQPKQNTHANSRKTGNMITIIIHSGFLYMYFLDEDMVPGQSVVSYTYCYNVQCLWFHVNMFCCGFCWYRSKNICIANLLLSCICIHDEKLRVCAYTKAAGNVDFTTYKYTVHYTSIIMLNCKPSHMCFYMSLIASVENSPHWCQLLAPTPPDLWSHARTQQQKYHFVKKTALDKNYMADISYMQNSIWKPRESLKEW